MTEYLAVRWYRAHNDDSVWHAFETWRNPRTMTDRHLSLCGGEGFAKAQQMADGDWHCKRCLELMDTRLKMES